MKAGENRLGNEKENRAEMRKIYLICGMFLLLSLSAMAVQPLWVIRAANNIRRAVTVAKRAKTAGQLVVALGKCSNSLPDEEVGRLARIASRPNGLKELNQLLGRANFIGRYGDEAGHLILQDTYLRIAIKNGRLTEKTASEVFARLQGTPGLTSLLSKINSSNFSQAKGHMRELEIALSAQRRGFTTISLGQKFADGVKKGDTDLDVFLRKNGRNFAIESKAYSGVVPDTMVKADAESLITFCRTIGGTTPVFCFETPPSGFTRHFLAEKGVKCLVGTPEEIMAKLDVLSNIMGR